MMIAVMVLSLSAGTAPAVRLRHSETADAPAVFAMLERSFVSPLLRQSCANCGNCGLSCVHIATTIACQTCVRRR